MSANSGIPKEARHLQLSSAGPHRRPWRLPALADNGTTLNGMERDMGWVEGLSPREAAELQREAEGPAGGASDSAAASHHWAVMRTVFSSVFWSQTY